MDFAGGFFFFFFSALCLQTFAVLFSGGIIYFHFS
jgi:hypothetical protein